MGSGAVWSRNLDATLTRKAEEALRQAVFTAQPEQRRELDGVTQLRGQAALAKAPLARRFNISRQHLYDFLAEKKPVSAAVAVRLGKLFGDGARVWVRMRGAYDVWHAECEVDVSRVEERRRGASRRASTPTFSRAPAR